MPSKSGSGPWVVTIVESERGWGRKVDEYRRFATRELAEAFKADYNKDLPDGPAPDWYMQAESIDYVPEKDA